MLWNRSEARAAAAAGIILAVLAFAGFPGPGIEDTIQRAAALAGKGLSPETSVVEIDSRSFLEHGEWPWSPAEISLILDGLHLANAAMVAIDSAVLAASDDRSLRTHLARDGKPWLAAGYDFYPRLADLPEGHETASKRAEAELAKRALPSSPTDDSTLAAMAGFDAKSVEASRAAPVSGFINMFPDSDGVIRRMTTAARFGEGVYPSLPLAAAAAFRGFTPLVSEDASGRVEGISIGGMQMRTSPAASVHIDYSRCPERSDRTSALELLKKRPPAESINGRIAILGIVDPEIAATYRTPAGRMSEAEIIACAIGQITAGANFVSLTGRPYSALAVALAAAVCIAMTAVKRSAVRSALTLSLAAAVPAISIFICAKYGILLPAAHFSAALIVLSVVSVIWRTVTVEIPTQRRLAPLRTRLSKQAMINVSENGESLNPEGRSCDVAAFAIGLRGFGAVSRLLDPARLCSFVRSYRDMVTGPLLDEGALIDSWSADECRAAFGSPLPMDNRAVAASRSAVKILHAASACREKMRAEYGVDKLRPGIGIWLGSAVQGQLGPAGADNFGVAGDAMEGAATLRSLNRVYRTSVLVNEEMMNAAEGSFRFRPLDPIPLHGMERPVLIYELVGEIGVIMPQLPRYLAARAAYLKGDFEQAEALFAGLLSEHPHDGPSQLFLRRTKTLLKSSPKAEWLGIWQS